MSKNTIQQPKTPKSAEAKGGSAAPTLLGIGEILPPKSMILRQHIGEASCGDLKYEMSTGMNGAPIVHSKQTGKWFTLSWKDILELADKAGIDA